MNKLTQAELEKMYTKAYRVVKSCNNIEQLKSAKVYVELWFKAMLKYTEINSFNECFVLHDFLHAVIDAKQIKLGELNA